MTKEERRLLKKYRSLDNGNKLYAEMLVKLLKVQLYENEKMETF